MHTSSTRAKHYKKEDAAMTTYKIVKLWGTQYGDCQFGIIIDGKAKALPYVGNIWKLTTSGEWARKLAVVESKEVGLLTLVYGKSKVARPLTLAIDEVYLPVEKTGRHMLLATLPE
jgi:hypothetical protein